MKQNRNNQNKTPIINRITVSVPPNNQQKDEFDKWGTYSDRIGWKINLAVAIVTLFLFGLTYYALQESRRANSIAQKALDNTIASGKADDIRADSVLEIQRRALQAQIDALNESRSQFSADRQPRLQLDSITFLEDINFYKRQVIILEFSNLNSTPIQITSAGSSSTCSYQKMHFNSKGINLEPRSILLTSSSPYSENTTIDQFMTPIEISDFIAGKNYFYIFGEVKYTNTLNNKKYVYQWQQEMSHQLPDDLVHSYIIFSKNTPVK